MTRPWGGAGRESDRLPVELLDPDVFTPPRKRPRKVDGKQVLEIAGLTVLFALAFALWFAVGVASGWVI